MKINISKTDIIIGLLGLCVLIIIIKGFIPKQPSAIHDSAEKESSVSENIEKKQSEEEKYTFFVDSSSGQIIDGTLIGEATPVTEGKVLDNLKIWLTEKDDTYELRIVKKEENIVMLECTLTYKETINGIKVYDGLYTRPGQLWDVEIFTYDSELQISDIVRGKKGRWDISWIINGNSKIVYAIVILPK